MKIPEPAPDWESALRVDSDSIVSVAYSNEMAALLQKANKDYLYWDKFKYLSMPEGVSPEVAWTCLKLSRIIQRRPIPFVNAEGSSFSYCLPDSILEEFHYIDKQAAGQILMDEVNLGAAYQQRYLIGSLMEEAIASSQLEGAATTRKVAKRMLRSGRKPKNQAEQMIVNNYNTIRHIRNIANGPLTPELLCLLQESMTKDTLDDPDVSGRFRNENDQIQVVDQRDGTVLHIPPPARELADRLDLLCTFANEKQKAEFIHPVVRGIILHFGLAHDHPFVDGNGRTSRALFYWYMLKHGYWLFEYLPISRIILRAPAQYYRAFLYSELDDRDITYFISFHLRTIRLAIKDLRKYLMKKQRELRKSTQLLRTVPDLNHRQEALLYHALTHADSSYTIANHKDAHGVVYQTARTDLLKLEEKGFLERRKIGKNFSFIPRTDLFRELKIEKEFHES